MNKERDQVHAVDYVRPMVVDLGDVTPVIGFACSAGTNGSSCTIGTIYEDQCPTTGPSPTIYCSPTGNQVNT